MKSFFQIKVKNLRVREKSDLAQNISAIKERMHFFTQEQKEVGIVFGKVLEHAGVYKRNAEGAAAFDRFINALDERN